MPMKTKILISLLLLLIFPVNGNHNIVKPEEEFYGKIDTIEKNLNNVEYKLDQTFQLLDKK